MKERRNRKRGSILSAAGILLALAAVVWIILGTAAGRRMTAKAAAGYIHNNIRYVPGTASQNKTNRTPEQMPTSGSEPEKEKETPKERSFFTFLLLGEEAIRSAPGKGRTDLVMLATINLPERSIQLVSLLRDTLVKIPGFQDNKLNAVYAAGGVKLLYEVLEESYGVRPDAYFLVGFEEFEQMIDRLGGVTVTLTAQEAEYLNTTNYIADVSSRNVVAGTQKLNGSQALGYCRIRKVQTCNGTKYDYGRTERQRMVLNSLFQQYVSAGIYEWVPLLREMLGIVQTDISQELLEDVLYAVYDNKITAMNMLQLPETGTFEEADRVENVTSVLIPQWELLRERLQQFLFQTE